MSFLNFPAGLFPKLPCFIRQVEIGQVTAVLCLEHKEISVPMGFGVTRWQFVSFFGWDKMENLAMMEFESWKGHIKEMRMCREVKEGYMYICFIACFDDIVLIVLEVHVNTV